MNKPALLCAMMLAAMPCLPATAANGPTIEAKVADQAREIGKAGRKKLAGALWFEGAAAEGRTLILKMSGMPEWRPGTTDAQMSKVLGGALCVRPNLKKLVAEGARIRIDATDAAGKRLPPLPIC